jgi:hypothetical protein
MKLPLRLIALAGVAAALVTAAPSWRPPRSSWPRIAGTSGS